MIRRAPAITRREFEERWSRAAGEVRRSGFDALLVCSRGGGALDRYGDVMYLTNFYSSFPFIPDCGAHWSARAHPFVLLDADGRAGLIADIQSRSKGIGKATNRQIDAFEAAISVVEAGIEAIRDGASAADIAVAGIRKQQALGYPVEGVFSGLGHGIGMGWDAPWLVPNDHTPLVENMVINLEKTLAMDGYVGDFEESVLFTRHGPEVLIKARKRHW